VTCRMTHSAAALAGPAYHRAAAPAPAEKQCAPPAPGGAAVLPAPCRCMELAGQVRGVPGVTQVRRKVVRRQNES
jgi:hypothetical protein